MFKKLFLIASILLLSDSYAYAMDNPTVVLELFTSQGCSSCPPADALLKNLSTRDPSVLPLSFHVHYWDDRGWKDTYSSSTYTDRQKNYEQVLGERHLFTPQLVINGQISVVGYNAEDIRQSIAIVRRTPFAVNVSLKSANAGQLIAGITANIPNASIEADVWEVRFNRAAKTAVVAGENRGRTLESINNVTSITSLGTWRSGENKNITLDIPQDSVAIIVQAPRQGPILGAAAYMH